MNIQGIITLKEKNMPLMENTIVFKEISEITNEDLNKYGNDKKWAIRGFDNRAKITDSPYRIKDFRLHGFSKDEIKEKYQEINSEMDKAEIPKETRIFLICRVFFDEHVEISGHALRHKNKILIDILKGNRPSGRDWTPDIAYEIEIKNGKPELDKIQEYKKYVETICKDILKFEKQAYLDFTLFKEGYFFYHDLSLH